VNELNDGRQRIAPIGFASAQVSGDEEQQRPESLAAAVDEIIRYLGNQRHVGAEILLKR
jgi:hypothetical protein